MTATFDWLYRLKDEKFISKKKYMASAMIQQAMLSPSVIGNFSNVLRQHNHAMKSQQYVRMLSPTSWIRAAVACGFDIKPLFQEAGIADALGTDAMPQIHVNALANLMNRCVEQAAPRFHFPLIAGEFFAFDALPALETFLSTSSSLRASLSALEWVHVVLPLLSMRLIEEDSDGNAALVMESGLADINAGAAAFFIEKDMASMARFARGMLGDKTQGQRVEFQHDPGQSTVQAIEQRHGVPVLTKQTRNALVFKASLLDEPLKGAISALNKRARAQVEKQLPPSLEAGVAEVIESWLMQEPNLLSEPLSLFAKRLNLHPRALQRRLDEVGQPFAALRDQCRQRLAQEMILVIQRGKSVEEIGELLGYSDRHSFTRAFKRWTGLSPSAWRDQSKA